MEDLLKYSTEIREEAFIRLTRDFLLPGRENKLLVDIDYVDFKMSIQTYQKSSIVVFIDDNNKTKVLKDRHSIFSKVARTNYGITHNDLLPSQVYQIALKEMEWTDKQIKSRWRKTELVQARAAIAIVLRLMFGFGTSKYNLTLKEIGSYVGVTKHSTVLAYWGKHKSEETVMNRVKRIQEKINQKIKQDEN